MTTISTAEIERRTQAALAALRRQNATKGPTSRYMSDEARRAVSEGLIKYHSRRVAADPGASPLKRARYEKGWSLRRTAAHAGLVLNSVHNAEIRPERTSWRVKIALSHALGVPTKRLFPSDGT